MLTTKDGGVPGANTPNEKALQAANLEGLKTAESGSQIIALWTRVKSAASGFTLDRGIDAYCIMTMILAVILLIQGVVIWMH